MTTEATNNDRPIIKVIGVGGGGGNAVNHMHNQGIVGVDFAVCNTDKQAMDDSSVPMKISLGPNLTEGRGAGARPSMGKEACIESIDDIRAFLEDNTKMLFITAGMGGGTGTGAAPIIAKAAKEMDILTVAIVTLPFKFEGMKRQRQALEGLEQLRKNVDSILVISNERLRSIYKDLNMDEAYAKADNILSTAAKGIAEIITLKGKINVDFADVCSVMKDSGVAVMGSAVMEGEDRAIRAIEAAVNSPLLEDNDIRGAKHILLNITTGTQRLSMGEMDEIMEYVQNEAGYGTDLFLGDCVDESIGNKISITFIATGFSESNGHKPAEAEPKRVLLDDELGAITGGDFTPVENTSSHTFEFEEDDVKSTIASLGVKDDATGFTVKTSPTKKPLDEKQMEIERMRQEYQRSHSYQTLDNPGNLAKLENEPAYKRAKVVLEDPEEEKGISRYSVSVDEDGPIIRRNNSFLHDNVD